MRPSFAQRAEFGQVAQLVEQRTENPRVVGSIPTLATRTNKGLGESLAPSLLPVVHGLSSCRKARVIVHGNRGRVISYYQGSLQGHGAAVSLQAHQVPPIFGSTHNRSRKPDDRRNRRSTAPANTSGKL